MSDKPKVLHPGVRIKAEVIPEGISVTKAAEILGVGRPALSNLLHGHAALSADMAARLEKAFKFSREKLMEMQAQYDAAVARTKGAPPNAIPYVPSFLAIKANQIEDWATRNISARQRLAVFLRALVHSTTSGLKAVNFPGNDASERPGWDGITETDDGTPWVPAGKAGWEFGVTSNIKGKADGDLEKSIKAVSKAEAAEITFVFVTPRRWVGKEAWVKGAKADGIWKDVRAYDCSDLEQWLEQSLPAQAWLASELQIPADGVRSLDKCWQDWTSVTEPPLPGELFNSAVEQGRRTMLEQLGSENPKPTFIAADSTEEALAYLSELFSDRGGNELAQYRDKTIVFDRPGTLPRLAETKQMFIPVVWTREVERELSRYAGKMPSIIVQPRNSIAGDANISLEPVNHEMFSRALEGLGKTRDEINRLASESGRSLTVLRRRMSTDPRLHTPDWARDPATAKQLIPFLLVGTWSAANETDRIAMELLAGDRSYEEMEREIHHLVQLNDAPVWSINTFRGVASKIDLLYAIEVQVTEPDLDRFYNVAGMVLGEDDSALDLPEGKRWAAAIHGKTRQFSQAFRSGISETLVLLAVYGPQLSFKRRLGMDLEQEAVQLVRTILSDPLTTRILEANDHDLPIYAEAAPTEFLDIIERDLRQDQPAVLGLMKPVDADFPFASPSRSGLLWALENLSWNSVTLQRAVLILARLAEVEIKDNWVNTPMNSLQSIFRVWMPQTAAPDEQRLGLLKELAKRHPRIAWQVGISQFTIHRAMGTYSHKPKWRADGYGFGEPIRDRERVVRKMSAMIDLALDWPNQTADMLCDLIERLPVLQNTDQQRVWELVSGWASTKGSDAENAILREKIRVTTMTRRARHHDQPALVAAAKEARAALEPQDVVNKYEWLFRESWVEESADEIEESDSTDYHARERRIQNLRSKALQDVFADRGILGLIELADRGNASWQVGSLAVLEVLTPLQAVELLKLAVSTVLSDPSKQATLHRLVAGVLHSPKDCSLRMDLIRNSLGGRPETFAVELLLRGPFDTTTWKLVDELSTASQNQYWANVVPDLFHQSDADVKEGIERLLKAGRPRAALVAVHLKQERVEVRTLYRLLSEMLKEGNDSPREYRLPQHDVQEAFELLNKSGEMTLDEMAGLEFAYLEVLEQPFSHREGYGIPNLEKYIELHPDMFVQEIVWTYKRRDGEEDPEQYQAPADRVDDFAERGFRLLQAINLIPGVDGVGKIDGAKLSAWITTVRASCHGLSRAEVADTCIGKMLSACPADDDGTWPCLAVREVMEQIKSEPMMRDAHTGVYNSRGVVSRSSGGDQERALAEKYCAWGTSVATTHPFVASQLLNRLAKTYEDEARREDMEADIRHRLR